ncbi:hypothetical protein K503DRAFT_688757, partial [Rhizopogon vinicolor AM-OR11-026]
RQVDAAEQDTPDYRHPPLPLACIKKVMKSDTCGGLSLMIAAEAHILFCKACESESGGSLFPTLCMVFMVVELVLLQ